MREYSAAGRPDARPGGRDATGESGTDLGGRERRLELRFRDDPLLPDSAKQREAARGRLGSIRPLERGADGVLRCSFDIALDD